jgi:uncharacterized membrane protein YphA (DoxX/SURF4 family)
MEKLKRFLSHSWTVRVCQVAIGLVLIVAALPKIGDMSSFATAVHNFRIVPVVTENLLAMMLPWIELVAGLALILGFRARAGGVIATALMGVFLVAILAAMVRGLDIECGCFGTADAAKVGFAKLAENTTYVVLAVVATLRPR